jgi:arylsulfatase B
MSVLPPGVRCSALLLASVFARAPAAAQSPPGAPEHGKVALAEPGNVLVLIADDLGAYSLAAYGPGADLPPTPRIDRMAATGVVFRNVWSQPLCSPTRATIETGRYGFRTGVGTNIDSCCTVPALPLEEVTLPEMLDLGTGGRTAHAMIGKWHLASEQVGGDFAPNLAGYGHFAGEMEGQIADYYRWRKVVDGVATITSRYATSACVDDALAWIRQQTGRWVCVVGFQAPHTPFHAPPARLHTQVLPSVVPPSDCSGPDPASARPFYKAMVQALDTEIGRLLDGLPDGEHTTVLFLGDNGNVNCTLSPPDSRPGKGSLYEGGIHVPMIASGYRVGRPGTCSALVNTTDFFATVGELAGVDLSATLPGLTLDSRSFVPCLADPRASVRDWIYAETFSRNGPGEPRRLPACPVLPVCQQDLGFDGPGTVQLDSCGEPLYGVYGGNDIPWEVTGGPPLARAWLGAGPFAPVYNAAVGSWLVSRRHPLVVPFVLDLTGSFRGSIWTGNTRPEINYQVMVQDPSQPLGFSVSNALRVELFPTDMRAIRNRRYKLIRIHPCREELYDLAADPLERTNLLLGSLSARERGAYDWLSFRMDALR